MIIIEDSSIASPVGLMSITATAGAGSEGLNIHGRNDSNNNWNNLMTVRRSGNVGIGVADPQAILDLSSTTSGFLPPKMTNTQRNNIVNPPEGSVVYNTSADKLNYYNGASWKNFGGGGRTTSCTGYVCSAYLPYQSAFYVGQAALCCK